MRWSALIAVAAMALGTVSPATARDVVTDRAVLIMRHGIRAPLDGEVPDGTRTAAPWPRWSVAESVVTPHGARALEIVAASDRALLAKRGLLSAKGCPAPGNVVIWANTSPRAIASGQAYARGFARGCGLETGHLPMGAVDPKFEALRARSTRFDADEAVVDINRTTSGMAALAAKNEAALSLLNHVLGCEGDCLPPGAPGIAAAGHGHDITLTGPIRSASGIAQVLLLQYLEGMPAKDVGWGRIDAKGLERLGALHADLFAVFTGPPYMAAHQASALGHRILDVLAQGPDLEVLMGHDTNVTALAAALRIDLTAKGYAVNDVPPGGAILIERVHDRQTDAPLVRVSYRTQPPATLRKLGSKVSLKPIVVPGCPDVLCPYETFAALLQSRLAPDVAPSGGLHR